MSDVGFVAASYAIVVGGLAFYVASLSRRVRAARRAAQALERERKLDLARRAVPIVPFDGGPTGAP